MRALTEYADLKHFIEHHRVYVDSAVIDALPTDTPLTEAAQYTLSSGGKRLRPIFTLTLADSLSVPFDHIKPLLQAIELIHTSSLIFDDLPAQDNDTVRRGKPAAHIAFNEWTAQLTGLCMLTEALGIITRLQEYFPAERVLAVERYLTATIGMEGLYKGQALDLSMKSGNVALSETSLLEMFHYKTSLMFEASLLPLLMLTNRSKQELKQIQAYAHHAGIVFQIQDDILDYTASLPPLSADTTEPNIVQLVGAERAQIVRDEHAALAYQACEALPFDTHLLKSMVDLFVSRAK
jgi:geranylgeranyl pyrophosphate synthase